MKKFIKLESVSNGTPIFINVDMIGDIVEVPDKFYENGKLKSEGYTHIGVLTHNNGGYKVVESAETILKLING